MFPTIDPTTTPAWKALNKLAGSGKKMSLRQVFASDPDRFKKMALCADSLVFDFSKNRIDDSILD